jgi:hypothetical protein
MAQGDERVLPKPYTEAFSKMYVLALETGDHELIGQLCDEPYTAKRPKVITKKTKPLSAWNCFFGDLQRGPAPKEGESYPGAARISEIYDQLTPLALQGLAERVAKKNQERKKAAEEQEA